MNVFARFRLRPAPLHLADPAVARDPFPHYEALRRRGGSVQFLAAHDYWIVLGHEECRAAFDSPRVFSNGPYAPVDAVLLAADPPRHTPVRKLVSRQFSAEALGRLSDSAGELARSLVRPELEVVEEFALAVSRRVTAELIGFEAAASADIVAAYEASLTAEDPLAAFIVEIDRLAERARLFHAWRHAGAHDLEEAELRSLIRLLWLAGTTTTERVITRAVLRLLQHPDLRAAVTADRALLVPFLEEVMRLHPPEHMVPRLTLEPVRLGGVDLPQGAEVRLCVSAANRDPAAWEAPAAIRFDRRGRRHFAFGGGIHQCLGAPLARRVAAAALGALLDGAPQLRALEPLEHIPYFATETALAPLRLRVGT
ncbi:MAG TPA: cytochrome P450 [Allosphingosinicella sp.]|nr:cytochrome P450 [Allosphingosinicella sp.]